MIRFANIQFIYALGILPLMVLVFFLVMRWKKRALQRLGDSDIISRLVPDVSLSKQSWKFILFLAAFFFLLVAMIDPQVGSREEEAKQEGIDIMICLDVSNSMMAEDLSPNRLERAKQAIAKLTEKLHGDRIGIVVFAGQAFVQLPITSDYGAAKLFLDNIDCDIVPVQGTAIGTAIDMAAGSFGAENTNSKAIIVIT
ncbi:MAG TPA: VWA domain-containing protein, partial [Bacteroidia bacterium]